MPTHKGVVDVFFIEFFVFAVVMTVAVVVVTVIFAVREFESRAKQRKQARVFTPASGLLQGEGQALGPNPELLHAVRRLG